MNESDWVACTDPQPMLKFLRGKVSCRKSRLFACACCRRIWQLLLDERSRMAIEVAERFADGLSLAKELKSALAKAKRVKGAKGNPGIAEDVAAMAAVDASVDDSLFSEQRIDLQTATAVGLEAANLAWEPAFVHAGKAGLKGDAAVDAADAAAYDAIDAARVNECKAQAGILRDLLGNPFRSLFGNPAWRTPNVVALAQAAYDERSLPAGTLGPDRLAILADALEDAGCTDAAILTHLRGPGQHVRGCWPVDLLLGKT